MAHTNRTLFAQGAAIGDSEGDVIANCTSVALPIDQQPFDERKANAARLAACWNAFHGTGIPTEKIEPEMVGEAVALVLLLRNSLDLTRKLVDSAELRDLAGEQIEIVDKFLAGLDP